MARPKKLTLDFYLHDADARGNRKIRSLRRKHGNDGYTTFFVLLEMLCQEDGLKLCISDHFEAETVAEECGLRDVAHLYAVLQTCTAIGLFDRQLWEGERVIFSHGLYERFISRLEERQKAAERKAKSRAEKNQAEALKKRVEDFQTLNSEDQNSEFRIQISDIRTQNSEGSQQDNEVVTRDNVVTTEQKERTRVETSSSETCDRGFQKFPWGYFQNPDPAFLNYLAKEYLPTIPSNEGRTIGVHAAKQWLIKGKYDNQRLDIALIQHDAFITWRDGLEASIGPSAALSADWLEQIAVLINAGKDSRDFFKLPDGRFDQEKLAFYNQHEKEIEELNNEWYQNWLRSEAGQRFVSGRATG